jgi:thiosulfate/3-mercaptopyruvate sulfurtransferase
MVVDANTVNAFRDDPAALILDVRAPERYEGKVEPIDPRAGHVPGAKSAPIAANLADDQRFKTPADLRELFSQLGAAQASKVVCYCGSGVNACQSIFALQLAGFSSVLYEGSWSDWSSQPDRPMATGPDPK